MLKKEISCLLDHVKKNYYKDGIFCTEGGYSIAFINNKIGIRIDLNFIESESETDKVVVIDITKSGNIKPSFIFSNSTSEKRKIYDHQINSYIRLFNLSFEQMEYEGRKLIDVEKFFKDKN